MMSLGVRLGLPLLAAFALLIIWEVSVGLGGAAELPRPTKVMLAGWRLMADGTLFIALWGSLMRVLQGFAFGALIGIPLGICLGLSPLFQRILQPVTESLRSIAPIAWIPLAILWLGVRGNAALFIVAYSAVFPLIVSAAHASRTIDQRFVRAAKTLGANRTRILFSVVIPSALPDIFTGARIAMAIAWTSIIAAELAIGIKIAGGSASVAGLGQMMVETLYIRRDMNALIFEMLIVGIASFAIDYGFRQLNSKLVPWTAS